MIKFEKVSFEQFKKDCEWCGIECTKEMYDAIKLPKRATKGSMAYDFFAPFEFEYESWLNLSYRDKNNIRHSLLIIPTGIRFVTDEKVGLCIVPRSSFGINFGMRLNNTISVIDSDYYLSKNEGDIFASIDFHVEKLTIKQGERFMQGMILPYYTTDDDDTTETRNGGIGSTGK